MKIIIAVNYSRKTLHRRCLIGFWICLGFWIHQRSEKYRGSEYTRVANIPGLRIYFWFWIYQDSESTAVLDMPGLHRVLNMPDYDWIIPEYAWLCLNLSEWLCFTFTYCNLLSTGTIDRFLGKLKFDFFYSGWKHLIFFERIKICCWGQRGRRGRRLWILRNQWDTQ